MSATVIALQGELGSGKTTFAQAFGKAFGVEERMPSPTFVIMKFYNLDPDKTGKLGEGFKRIVHVDAYRIESDQELLNLGWEDLIKDSGNIILIEWPENVENLIPKEAKRIHFKHEK